MTRPGPLGQDLPQAPPLWRAAQAEATKTPGPPEEGALAVAE